MLVNYVRNSGNLKKIIMLVSIVSGAALISNVSLWYWHQNNRKTLPLVINTWDFVNANKQAWYTLLNTGNVLDAVEVGCTTCEKEQCGGTVGYGGSPDEKGETTLDAMIMEGATMNIGAVGALRKVKNAVSVARYILEHTTHTMLVGDQATEFATQLGFKEEPLSTNASTDMWKKWKARNCQPNFWTKVKPDPTESCGPYEPFVASSKSAQNVLIDKYNHDTIGIIAMSSDGNIAVATSTNGAKYKIPGRVGDSPIPGAGAYVENNVGAAVATGDGDVMMRFLPSLKAVEKLKSGHSPSEAGTLSLRDIAKYYPDFKGGIVVVTADGKYGAACYGFTSFPYTITFNGSELISSVNTVECVHPDNGSNRN